MVKQIILTQGKFAIVDDDNFEWLNQWKWHIMKKRGFIWYAMRNTSRRSPKREVILMHRAIMKPSPGLGVDHRNMNGLDNRRANLRCCTSSQNQMNSRKRLGCTSRFKGVYWHRKNRSWGAKIQFNGKAHHLGSFDDELEAAKAYNKAASEFFGEFARLNVIEESI